MTPFQAVYWRTPPNIPIYLRGSTPLAVVEEELIKRDETFTILRHNLGEAQHRMKQAVDGHGQEKYFQVGDLVLVKLIPYRQTTVAKRLHSKLCKIFFGPFHIIARVESVAYNLLLPLTVVFILHSIYHNSSYSRAKSQNRAPLFQNSA